MNQGRSRAAPDRIDRPGTAESAAALQMLDVWDIEVIRPRLPDAGLTDREGAGGPVLPAGVVAHFTRRHEVLLR